MPAVAVEPSEAVILPSNSSSVVASAVAVIPNGLLEMEHLWEQFLLKRYPESAAVKRKMQHQKDFDPSAPNKDENEKRAFRDYDADVRPTVREFYRVNHEKQTLAYVLEKKETYGKLSQRKMGIWEAMEYLNTLVDDSDPDTDLTQIQHLLQTAESLRAAGKPRWMILTGLIHDLGKILTFYGEPQWAVVGDTFPVGCAYAPEVVFSQYFAANPDFQREDLMTLNGIYELGCGLNNIHMSFGHDEYLYMVVKHYLPPEALYIIRYHSFYAAHREHAYQHLMNDFDRKMLEVVREFNPHDLYSKGHSPPDVDALKPYYMELISEFFPEKIDW